MDILGICICPEHLNEVIFGLWPAANSILVQADMIARRFGRLFLA